MRRIVRPEWLDELSESDPRAVESRRDLRRVNAWMGHVGIITRALRSAFPENAPSSVVELGAGDGSVMLRVARRLAPEWGAVRVTLVDRQTSAAPEVVDQLNELGWTVSIVQAEIREWLAQAGRESGGVMLANLVLHHFSFAELAGIFRSSAAQCGAFVAAEPRRSRVALLAARSIGAIGCNAVSRHDGPLSVRAGFSGRELSRLWPSDPGWALREGPSRLFSHLFTATRIEARAVLGKVR